MIIFDAADQSTSKSDLNDATQMMINYAFAVSNAVSNRQTFFTYRNWF